MREYRSFWTAVVILIVAVLVGIAAAGNGDTGNASVVMEQRTTLRRTVDAEACVVCWTGSEGGLSCLPIDQTLLGQPEIGD